MLDEKLSQNEDDKTIDIGYQPVKPILLLSDITGLVSLVQSCFEKVSLVHRKNRINQLMCDWNWHEHYKDKVNGRCVLSELTTIEHIHELKTAILLAKVGYDVIFDVFLVKDSFIIKADLKSVSSKHPDTIDQRVRTGSEQAPYVVIHITSNIEKRLLIEGIRKGVIKNSLIKDIFLIYKGKFYRLSKTLIMSDNLYKVFK